MNHQYLSTDYQSTVLVAEKAPCSCDPVALTTRSPQSATGDFYFGRWQASHGTGGRLQRFTHLLDILGTTVEACPAAFVHAQQPLFIAWQGALWSNIAPCLGTSKEKDPNSELRAHGEIILCLIPMTEALKMSIRIRLVRANTYEKRVALGA